jgi:hypothetical protein
MSKNVSKYIRIAARDSVPSGGGKYKEGVTALKPPSGKFTDNILTNLVIILIITRTETSRIIAELPGTKSCFHNLRKLCNFPLNHARRHTVVVTLV